MIAIWPTSIFVYKNENEKKNLRFNFFHQKSKTRLKYELHEHDLETSYSLIRSLSFFTVFSSTFNYNLIYVHQQSRFIRVIV